MRRRFCSFSSAVNTSSIVSITSNCSNNGNCSGNDSLENDLSLSFEFPRITDLSIEEILPDDLLLLVFSYLFPEDLYHVVLVNRRWSILSSLDQIWKPFCCPHWNFDVEVAHLVSRDFPTMSGPKSRSTAASADISFPSSSSTSKAPRNIMRLSRSISSFKSYSSLTIPNINSNSQDFTGVATSYCEQAPFTWKKRYISWLRRNMKRLKEIHEQNNKLLEKFKNSKGLDVFYPINFFWPSYTALRERYTFRILVLGCPNSGKSSLILRFTNDTFSIGPVASELKIGSTECNGHIIELQILDSGSEHFRNSKIGCYLQAHAIFLCYDANDQRSFQGVKRWLSKIRKHNTSSLITFLIATKMDMDPERQEILYAQGKSLADSEGIPFWATSSKTSENVFNCFNDCAKIIYQHLAWPRYVPEERTLRAMLGLPELDWFYSIPGSDLPRRTRAKSCALQ